MPQMIGMGSVVLGQVLTDLNRKPSKTVGLGLDAPSPKLPKWNSPNWNPFESCINNKGMPDMMN